MSDLLEVLDPRGSAARGDGAPAAGPADDAPGDPGRRGFLRATAAGAALAALSACDVELEELLRKHFRELSPAELEQVLARVERRNQARFGRKTRVAATPAREGVEFGYGLDVSRCLGCRRCVYACARENNPSRKNPQIHWIQVLEMQNERGVDLRHAELYYEAKAVPRPGHFYFPVACQQCREPACVKSCPASATWKEPDGIVVVDYDWCIGCRCCMAACPYGARHFNWGAPTLAAGELNPDQHYLGNRPRPRGVVEKCTFCIQRTRQGRYPACVEICPVGARKFGNLLDPESEIRKVMAMKRVFVFKEELATNPRFYYFHG